MCEQKRKTASRVLDNMFEKYIQISWDLNYRKSPPKSPGTLAEFRGHYSP